MANNIFSKIRNTLLFAFITLIFCSFLFMPGTSPDNEKIVLIATELGDIKIKLYNKTPKHRDNFLKLVSEKFYDGVLFHRVIKDFMIQTGDPQSKKTTSGEHLGNGGPGYTIPAEFVPEYFHKKGALAAARQGDNVNPEKESSGSQFYIVQGKVFTDEELTRMEKNINQNKKRTLFQQYINKKENAAIKARLDSLRSVRDNDTYNKEVQEIDMILNRELEEKGLAYKFSSEQRKAYTTVGGTPHLDGGYTVFGEVVGGLDVVEKIANIETDKGNRPLKDIIITIKVVN